jgi:hypothetical protein
MGEYVNGHTANILSWLAFTLMAVASVAMFATRGITI